MIVTPDQFFGEINIADTNKETTQEQVQKFIEKYEPKFYGMLIGTDLYVTLNQHTEDTSGVWYELILKTQDACANYIYWYWMRNEHTYTSSVGEAKVKAQNSIMANPAEKMVRAWNEMVDLNWELVRNWDVVKWGTYMNGRNIAGYYTACAPEIFHHVNTLGI